MCIVTIFLCIINYIVSLSVPDGWMYLAPGMDILRVTAKKLSTEGDSKITVVRIDPGQWDLVFLGKSNTVETSDKTAREWCEKYKLTAAINAGMFGDDYRTHVGYLKYGNHINSGHSNNYQSVLAFDPYEGKEVSPFCIFDLDNPGVNIQTILYDYSAAIQNLRLIKKPGINVWKQQDRKWSEAAIGEDKEGRILFIISRSPFSMYDLNKELLEAGIGIVAAQHLEGGPEAQLYLRIGDFEIDQFGSFETSYQEDDGNANTWPIPNILGIRPVK